MTDQFLDLKGVTRRLFLCESTVRALIKSGELKAFLIAGRYRFDPADVQDFLSARRVAR